MIKPRVFSWRDHVMVEVEDPSQDLTGWRVNILDEVYPSVERAIDAIEGSIVALEKVGPKWHAGSDTDLMCVVHNCLYWQCECGNNLLPQTQPGEIVEWLSHNFGEFVKNHRMQTLDECLEPVCDAPRKLQVSNCEPLYTGSWKVNGLFIELGNGMKFKVKIEVTK